MDRDAWRAWRGRRGAHGRGIGRDHQAALPDILEAVGGEPRHEVGRFVVGR
jgi:hypothetical protein